MKKKYPIEVVLSLTTGVLLTRRGFGAVHKLAEHVAGHPIWTHEFADESLRRMLADAVFAQHSQLRDAEAYDETQPVAEYLPGYVARQRKRFGATLDIDGGASERTETPIESAHRLMGRARGES